MDRHSNLHNCLEKRSSSLSAQQPFRAGLIKSYVMYV